MSEPSGGLEAAGAEERKRLVREKSLRVILTPEARQRLTNVKIVKPDIAEVVENYILQLVSSGRLKRALSDDELKEILASIQQPKKDFKIRWA